MSTWFDSAYKAPYGQGRSWLKLVYCPNALTFKEQIISGTHFCICLPKAVCCLWVSIIQCNAFINSRKVLQEVTSYKWPVVWGVREKKKYLHYYIFILLYIILLHVYQSLHPLTPRASSACISLKQGAPECHHWWLVCCWCPHPGLCATAGLGHTPFSWAGIMCHREGKREHPRPTSPWNG